jgi:PP-loop superfamily ATP-utilizing enzyme
MEDYFKSAIVYYFQHLVKNGSNDPVKVIIADLLDTVKITEEQKKYIYEQTGIKQNQVDSMLILIKKMRVTNEIDQEALKLIEEGLKQML